MTFFVTKKALYDIEPSGFRTAGMLLTLFTTALSLSPAHDDRHYIDAIESVDCDLENPENPPTPPLGSRTPVVWGGTRLGQWVIVDRVISLLKAAGLADRNTVAVVDHGRYSCDLFLSDLPNGRLSNRLQQIAERMMNDIVRFCGGAVQGWSSVIPMSERPMSRDPSPTTVHLVTRKFKGEHVPIPFSEIELRNILKADITHNGVLRAIAEIRPRVRGRYLLEWRKFGVSTAAVQVLDSNDYDVREECDWFERVFPELITPGIEVIAQPATSLPRTGMYMVSTPRSES